MGYIVSDEKAAGILAKAIKGLSEKLNYVEGYRIQIKNRPKFSLEFCIEISNKDAAHFKLIEMPGCCGILISTETWVLKEFRGQGLAQEMMLLKEAIAKEFGYTLLLASVRLDNPAEIHILEKYGWKQNESFKNSRTGNDIAIFTKNLAVELKSKKEK